MSQMSQMSTKCQQMSTKCQQNVTNVTNVNKMSTNVNKMSQMSTKCHKCQQNFAKFCNFFFAKSGNISKFFEILQFFLKTVEMQTLVFDPIRLF